MPVKIQLILVLFFLLTNFAAIINAQTGTMENQKLSAKQKSLIAISSLTARGDLEKLRTSLSDGLDAGLTVNEIKENLVQLYAYCGFPRSLNGINTFRTVLEERKSKGIKDAEAKTATAVSGGDKYERGRKTLETLTGQPQKKPAPGFGEFAPRIDVFLKEHLFADIFDSDVLSYAERELVTIAALTSMEGVEPQLESHLRIGMNVGLTEPQLNDLFGAIENAVGKRQADEGRKILGGILKKSTNMENEKSTIENKNEDTIFPKGERAPAENFTGTVYVQMLAQKNANNNFSIGSVTFEPGARSNWHTHPAGQTLLVTNGTGLYQEKGKPVRTINKGETIVCDKDVEHWHGASPTSGMSHVAITNFKGDSAVVWLKPVSDEEYGANLK